MIRLLLALLSLALVTPAAAHRQPEVETTVEVAGAEGEPSLGITHRMHAHDAMTLLRALGETRPDLDDPRQLAELAVYAADHVELTGDASSEPIGAELEGNYVFIYVRHPEMAAVQGATLLDGAIPGWTNTVHTKDRDGTTLRSVTFDAEHPRLIGGIEPMSPSARSGAHGVSLHRHEHADEH